MDAFRCVLVTDSYLATTRTSVLQLTKIYVVEFHYDSSSCTSETPKTSASTPEHDAQSTNPCFTALYHHSPYVHPRGRAFLVPPSVYRSHSHLSQVVLTISFTAIMLSPFHRIIHPCTYKPLRFTPPPSPPPLNWRCTRRGIHSQHGRIGRPAHVQASTAYTSYSPLPPPADSLPASQ